MRSLLNTLAIMLFLVGGIFFLQGINVLPGSFMTGDPQWAINGLAMITLGLCMLGWTNRRR
ncbi:MAG: hypothetical protein M3Y68_13790 [Chloroflexota bacterium]|nr:hypothetical protein [Chloroflexota bacterium]